MMEMWRVCVFVTVSAHYAVSYSPTDRKCGSPPVFPGMKLIERYAGKSEFTSRERVAYKCELGFMYLYGSRFSYCYNGEWSHVTMQCGRKRCGSAGEIMNGRFRQTGNAFGDRAYAECHSGYVLIGEPMRECGVHGWSGNIPTCLAADLALLALDTAVLCPLSKDEYSATFHTTKEVYKPGDTVSYSCNVGYQLIGDVNVLRCENDGKWDPRHPKCHKIDCESLTIANGIVRFSHVTFNTKVEITCKNGYYLRGPSVVICRQNGTWPPELPTCEQDMPVQVTCPPPAVPHCITPYISKLQYNIGEQATISCQEGFELIGSSQVTCGADGHWWKMPECRFVGGMCPAPPYVPNAHTMHSVQMRYEPLTTLRYKCNHGYHRVRGRNTINCRNGQWSKLEMMCEKKKCGSAGEIENGRFHYTGALFGDTVTASCNKGYHLIGLGVRHCRAHGWDGRVPICEAIQCPEPPLVPGADLFFDTSGIIKFGYIASYRCLHGTLIGDADIYCTEDGTWSTPAPRCEVTCPTPNVMFAVIVSGRKVQYDFENSVKFMCQPGRRLSGPEVITCGMDGHWTPRLPQCVI